jgi:hypothetical protein
MNNPEINLKIFWGFLEYKPQWSLTGKGWLFLIVTSGLIFIFLLTNLRNFLAVHAPIDADALVIEGWVGDTVIKGGVGEFNRGNYRYIITTGNPIYKGFFLTEYTNYAELARDSLIKLGVAPEKIITVAIPEVKQDRTAAMAMAVKNQLLLAKLPIKSLNIYSCDVHTRRSYLIYKRVLQPELQVGAIADADNSYDHQKWWTSSRGFRFVTEEAIAYIYARLIWKL